MHWVCRIVVFRLSLDEAFHLNPVCVGCINLKGISSSLTRCDQCHWLTVAVSPAPSVPRTSMNA